MRTTTARLPCVASAPLSVSVNLKSPPLVGGDWKGKNVVELQKILGHEKLDTTMIYAKVCQENVKYNHRRYVV